MVFKQLNNFSIREKEGQLIMIRVNLIGIYNDYKPYMLLKTEPQIHEGKTDRMKCRNSHLNNNT